MKGQKWRKVWATESKRDSRDWNRQWRNGCWQNLSQTQKALAVTDFGHQLHWADIVVGVTRMCLCFVKISQEHRRKVHIEMCPLTFFNSNPKPLVILSELNCAGNLHCAHKVVMLSLALTNQIIRDPMAAVKFHFSPELTWVQPLCFHWGLGCWGSGPLWS